MAIPSFGIETLIARINLLSGLSVSTLTNALSQNNFLRIGASELVNFAKKQGLTVIICSGNIQPVVNFYKKLLGADVALGSPIDINQEGLILGTKLENFLFTENIKVNLIKKFFNEAGLNMVEAVSVGDSSIDVNLFEKSRVSVAVSQNPQAIESAQYQIQEDLSKIIPIMKQNLE